MISSVSRSIYVRFPHRNALIATPGRVDPVSVRNFKKDENARIVCTSCPFLVQLAVHVSMRMRFFRGVPFSEIYTERERHRDCKWGRGRFPGGNILLMLSVESLHKQATDSTVIQSNLVKGG
jgi:hypothetical protein